MNSLFACAYPHSHIIAHCLVLKNDETQNTKLEEEKKNGWRWASTINYEGHDNSTSCCNHYNINATQRGTKSEKHSHNKRLCFAK